MIGLLPNGINLKLCEENPKANGGLAMHVALLARHFVPHSREIGLRAKHGFVNDAEGSLVLESGWNPAEGKSKPPLAHAEFAAKMREWIENGAAIPD